MINPIYKVSLKWVENTIPNHNEQTLKCRPSTETVKKWIDPQMGERLSSKAFAKVFFLESFMKQEKRNLTLDNMPWSSGNAGLL